MRELSKLPAFVEGAKAMTDQLPDVAVGNFRSVLANKKLSDDARAYATLSLIEALVSASLTANADPNLSAEALELLSNKQVAALPSAPIWRAEALASQGRYQDAAKALADLKSSHPNYTAILMARSRIHLALRQTDTAIDILSQITKTKGDTTAKLRDEANLLIAETHIDTGHNQQALQALEKIDEQNLRAAKLKEYLQARLVLSEGNSAEAIDRFQSIISDQANLTERILHASTLGLADAQAANKQNLPAVTTLEKYITDHPESTALQPLFMRIARLLPVDLPNDDPSMANLIKWSSDTTPASHIDLANVGTSAAAMPIHHSRAALTGDLQALAIYYRAKLLIRSEKKEQHDLARALLAQLRMLHSQQPVPPSELFLKLSSASLLDTANLHMLTGNTELATYTLSAMEKVAFSPQLKTQASFLRGQLLAKDARPEEALSAFEYARESSSEDIAAAAQINTGITALLSSNLKAFKKVLISADKLPIKKSLQLERALWKCSNNDASGRQELDSFIMANIGHPRENEARLALAKASVDISPPDIILARAQLDKISPRLPDADSQLAITMIRMRAEDLDQKWQTAAEAAALFLSKFPTHSAVPAVLLKQGEVLFHNEDYGRARSTFQKITTTHADSPEAPFAKFYTAMSARLGGTARSREESIQLFQEIINKKLPLANEARLQLGRVLIDLGKHSEAEKTLLPLVKPSSPAKIPPALRRGAGILLADCQHRQGATNSNKYQQAIDTYQLTLAQKDLPAAWVNKIHFLQGQTYEAMGNKLKAFSSYFSIIARGQAKGKPEWLWFYRCGFKALSMLESDQRWEASVKLARRIASFKGPRAEEAAQRAQNLAKKHMIWED